MYNKNTSAIEIRNTSPDLDVIINIANGTEEIPQKKAQTKYREIPCWHKYKLCYTFMAC